MKRRGAAFGALLLVASGLTLAALSILGMESRRRVGAGTVLLKDIYDLIARTRGIHPALNYKGKDLEDRGAEGECEEGREPEAWKRGSYTDFSDGTIKELFIRDFSNSIHIELWGSGRKGENQDRGREAGHA